MLVVLGTGLEPVWLAPRDFLHTSAFAAGKAVRALDYALAVAFALGPRRLVSTPSPKGLARRYLDCTGQGIHRL